MASEYTEILLNTAVKTEVEAINQKLNTNSLLIGLQTPQEHQKEFVMKQEPYSGTQPQVTGAGTQLQDTGHDTRSEESRDNVQSWEAREKPKADVSNGHLQIHSIGDYQTQDTTYDQLNPDAVDVLPLQDHTYPIQTKKCMYDQQIKIYNDPSNSNDVWEFLPIQDPRSNNQTQDSINFHPSQDMKHWTVTSTGLLHCVKPEGDRTCMTRNYYLDDTKGMLIKSEGWSLDKNSNAEVAEHSEADLNLTTQMLVPDVGVTCPPPIVIQPEQPVLTEPNHFQTNDVKTASERQLSSYRNSLCREKSNVSTLLMQSPTKPPNIPQSLPSHMCTLPVETSYKCTLCDKTFTCNSSLLSHQLTHSTAKPCKCTFCGKGFSSRSNLTIHKRIHTGEKPYKCDVCKKGFIRKSEMKTHQWTHTGEKPYKCTVCGKEFSRRGDLTRHEDIHTGEKPYKCDECEKWFRSKGLLSSHQQTHTGEKPHKCTLCVKTFTYKCRMLSHQRTHTQAKPYNCTFCGSVFSRQYNLTAHELIHTGEKPYKCDVCGKQFLSEGNLKHHQWMHTVYCL